MAKKSIRKSKHRNITLDIDWTGIESKKEESNWSYKGRKSMSSLTAFISETGVSTGYRFQGGNVSPLSGIDTMLAHIIFKLEQNGDIRVTRSRSDSAGDQAGIINRCEKGITYGIRMKMDAAVVKTISTIREEAWKPLIGRDGYEIPGCQVCSTVHTMN